MSQPTCAATTKRGAPCRSFALPGQATCLMHDPERRDEVAAARSRGGVVATKLRAIKGKRRRLDTHAGLSRFLDGLIHDLIDGTLEPDIAKVAIYGCSVMRALNEHGIERRLAELERLLAQRRAG